MKRFYREAGVTETDDGYAIALDGRIVRTPGKNPLVLPARALAASIAAEWDAQPEEIEPAGMHLTRLANSAIDQVASRRDGVIEEVTRYAGTDLVCYRDGENPDLQARQQAGWQPLVDWVTAHFGASLVVTSAMLPAQQPSEALSAMRVAVADFDIFPLTGLHAATAACGSLVIGLALAHRRVNAEEAWSLSLIEELFQAEKWGEDTEAADRRSHIRAEIMAAGEFMELSVVE